MGFSDEFNQADGQRILVTGATGFVGSRLIASKEAQSHFIKFRAATRGPLDMSSPNVEEVRIPDISINTDWSMALSNVDVIIHLAARVHVMHDKVDDPLQAYREANVASTLHLARQAAKAGVKRFVFLSSIKVNGERTKPGQPFIEGALPYPADPYGISKLEAEEGIQAICKQTGMEFVFIRPPLIYGPGVKANYLKLMQLVRKRLPLPLGDISNHRSMLALDNLVDFILLAARHPKAANQLFLLSDEESLSTTQLIHQIALSMGFASARLISLPVQVLKMIGQCLGQSTAIERLTDSLEINSQKARDLLNWSPPLSAQEGIQLTVDDFLSHQKVM